jgi:hypothetical protein
MKRVSFMVALLSWVVMTSCGTATNATTNASPAATHANAVAVSTMLENRAFIMILNSGYANKNTSSNSIVITDKPYYAAVTDDQVEVFLPYNGDVYRNAYSSDYTNSSETLSFKESITDYQITQNKKGMWIVTFEARATDDNYQFRIEVSPAGEVRLTIVPAQKQNVSYKGYIYLESGDILGNS